MNLEILKNIFTPKTFNKKYQHVGCSYYQISNYWKPYVEHAIYEIEKLMWPRWMPFWSKRLIHYLATDNSVFKVKYFWAYNIRSYFTGMTSITQIKDKYGTLRIYGYFSPAMEKIILRVQKECLNTCEHCGASNTSQVLYKGWVTNLCQNCISDEKN